MLIDIYLGRKVRQVMRDTWGQLAPQRGKLYKGIMIYTHSIYGDIVLLYTAFEGLDFSPWLFESMQEYIAEHCKDEGLYKWEGCLKVFDADVYCFDGELKRLEFEVVANERRQVKW